MTRLVVVNHFPVLPPRGGGQLAVAGLTAALAAHWPTELVWAERRSAPAHEVEFSGQHFVVTAIANHWLQRHSARWLRRALGRVDTDIGSLLGAGGHRALVAHLASALRDGDILMLAHPWLWPAVRQVLARRRLRFVFDAHNVETRLKRESYPDNPIARCIVEQVRRTEAEIVRRADLVLACTEADAGQLAGTARERVHVGSKGIAPSAAADTLAAARADGAPARVALFVGSEHGPNNEAARWIIEALGPACPHWRFDIAGTCGPAAGASPATPNVRVLGRVDDLGVLLAQAGIALNPMAGGSGINMKLFEYLQSGLPVVSTPFGARGFESLPACGILQVERAGFGAAIEGLAQEPATWRRLAAEGPACVRAHFEWSVIGTRIAARIAALHGASAR